MKGAALAILAVLFGARGFQPSGSPERLALLTYAKDIAPLVNDRCVMCHHSGGSAPFALQSYSDVKHHASQIAAVTASRYMPPWKADPIDGPFVGQHPLSDVEIATIKEWVDEGAAEGDPRSVP